MQRGSWIVKLAVCAAVVNGAFINALFAEDYDWESMPFTPHSTYQAVDGDGFSTFPFDAPARMRGVILNRSAEILDPAPGAPGFLGGMWQVFVQTDMDGDFGGSALWMGQYLGRMNGTHPQGSYSDSAWLDELYRLEHDPASDRPFEPGDIVEIRARAPGMAFRGKSNINEMHTIDPAADYDVVLIQANAGLPDPQVITLADLKDATDDFIFDSTRLTGPEHYQGTLIRINDVQFASTTGWAPGGSMAVTDGAGRTMPVLLGIGDGFTNYDMPTGVFDIIGFLDQEDYSAEDGYKDGYRIWLIDNYDGNLAVMPALFPTGDYDYDNDVDLDDYYSFAQCLSGPGNEPVPSDPQMSMDCLGAFDFDHDGDVDLEDFAKFKLH